MTIFRYGNRRIECELSGLSMPNFSTMIFNSGAGDTRWILGTLKRDANGHDPLAA